MCDVWIVGGVFASGRGIICMITSGGIARRVITIISSDTAR